MRLKTGPILVIVALVLLVGMALVLSPAPPPATEGHDHEHEAEKPSQTKTEPPKPKFDLAQTRKLLAANDPHAQSKATDDLMKAVAVARGAEKDELVRFLTDLVRNDKRENLRASAVGMLSNIRETDPQLLINVVENDSSPEVRKTTLLALSRYPAGGPVEQVLRRFAQDPDPGLRSAAIISLTQMLASSGQAGTQQLCSLLGQHDNDASAKAALALSQSGDRALPVVIETLYRGQTGPQREGAAMAIAMICAGFNPSIQEFARQAQVTHRQEPLHKKANLAGLEPLLWALKNDPWAPTREVAAQGLGYLGDRRAAQPLAAALKDPDKYVRRRAAAALITVPAAGVVAELSQAATGDVSGDVRRFAVEALGWVGQASVVPALIQATADKSATVRRYAALELGKIADPQSLDALGRLLSNPPDPDADVRWAAVTALGKLRDKRTEKILVQCLSDPSPQVSNSAERALQKLGIARQEKAGYEG